ncbi:MAG: hypothetical protein EOP00_03160 [Pedobacter sp.]|nr:MAG: hypothetical protein EOP00_03160 [Pedobacter sp.]
MSTKKDTAKLVREADKKMVKEVTQDPIIGIKTTVEHINTVKLTKKHFEFECDELTKVDYFYEHDKIVKISVDFGTIGDVYAKEDYYYNGDQLVFKYEFVEGGPACEGCIETHEYRSYVHHNQVIKYLKDKGSSTCRKCEFTNRSKEYQLLKAGNAAEIKAVLCT